MERLLVDEIARACGGQLVQGDRAEFIRSISTDSRTVEPGAFFIPLKGDRFDGHDFVVDALEKGARGAIVQVDRWARLKPSVERLAAPDPPAIVLVGDTLDALHAVARYYRKKFPIPVVAVTGTVGKTTTKDILAAIFKVRHAPLYTHKNLNNEIGVPLTILQLEKRHYALVLEMGMRGPGQIRRLAETAAPTIGVVTNVGESHLEHLGTLENVAAAKAELVEALPEDGTAVLNADDPRVASMATRTRARPLFYGTSVSAEVRGEEIRSEGEAGVSFRLVSQGTSRRVRLNLVGAHYVMNALAAAAAAFAAGLGWEDVEAGLANVEPSGMRMQVMRAPGGFTVVNDAYNANPQSMRAALATLADLAGHGRRVAVLGEMLELGPVFEQAHRQVGRAAAAAGVDLLIAVGPGGALIGQGAVEAGRPPGRIVHCTGAAEAAQAAVQEVQPGDVVLVKASRGIHLEQVVEALLAKGKSE